MVVVFVDDQTYEAEVQLWQLPNGTIVSSLPEGVDSDEVRPLTIVMQYRALTAQDAAEIESECAHFDMSGQFTVDWPMLFYRTLQRALISWHIKEDPTTRGTALDIRRMHPVVASAMGAHIVADVERLAFLQSGTSAIAAALGGRTVLQPMEQNDTAANAAATSDLPADAAE